MSIAAKDGMVVWTMNPARARKVARVLAEHTDATSEVARLRAAADEAVGEGPPRSIHSQ